MGRGIPGNPALRYREGNAASDPFSEEKRPLDFADYRVSPLEYVPVFPY